LSLRSCFFTAPRSFTDPALGFRITQRFWSLRGTSSKRYFPNAFFTSPTLFCTLPATFSVVPRSRRSGLPNRFPCLLFDFSFSFVDPAFDFILCTRVHTFNSGLSPSWSGSFGPIFLPGWNLHTAQEIGIDDFQAKRSPDNRYRTEPLRALFDTQKIHKGGFYHDGRFATLPDVVNHYDRTFKLGLTEQEKNDLIDYLKFI
jgi:hypothetical protein